MARENFEYSFFQVHFDDVVIAAPLDSLIEIIKKLRAKFKTFNILDKWRKVGSNASTKY